MTPTFVSDLFRDYLAHADSIAAGVPDVELLKQSLSDTMVGKPPRLVAEVQANPEKRHTNKIIFDVHLVITAETKITPRATVDVWLAAIRSRISDIESFAAWVTAHRDIADPAPWQISRLRVFASTEEFGVDNDTTTYTLALPCSLTVHLAS